MDPGKGAEGRLARTTRPPSSLGLYRLRANSPLTRVRASSTVSGHGPRPPLPAPIEVPWAVATRWSASRTYPLEPRDRAIAGRFGSTGTETRSHAAERLG